MPAEPLLEVRNLSKSYVRKQALSDVSFTLERGRTLGLAGASGSGKSTLARCLTLFEEPTSGAILFDGAPITRGGRRRIQLIFQQPASSLNPRFTAAEIVGEPLVIGGGGGSQTPAQALELVGLPASALPKHPHEFSGGERQRLAIARALMVEPQLLILDESFAGLDPSLQDQIVTLLRELQQRLGLSYLLISHDLTLVGEFADEIAILSDGRIVEHGPAMDVLASPVHPLTRELVAAARALAL